MRIFKWNHLHGDATNFSWLAFSCERVLLQQLGPTLDLTYQQKHRHLDQLFAIFSVVLCTCNNVHIIMFRSWPDDPSYLHDHIFRAWPDNPDHPPPRPRRPLPPLPHLRHPHLSQVQCHTVTHRQTHAHLINMDHHRNIDDIYQFRDGKTRGRCGRVRAIFFLGCANLLPVYAQTG